MYLFSLAAVSLFGWGFYRRIAVYRRGKPLNRTDQLPRRIFLMLRGMLGQFAVMRGTGAGTLHAIFFWSFFSLFLGTLLIMAQADVSQPLFKIVFLKGTFYKTFSLALDLAGFIALLMLSGLLIRRFGVKPVGLKTNRDDYIAHSFLFAIILTGFVVEGIRIAATELHTNPELARFSPVGMLVGLLFVGVSANDLLLAHRVLWWVHLVLAMGFIAAIPFTKLRHIFTTSANYFFADLRPKGTVTTLNLENEAAEQFGTAQVQDLTWKDIFDADACTSCSRCQDRCPAWNTGKPLSPMNLVQQIGAAAFSGSSASLIDTITEDFIWACTTCLACQDICPVGIGHLDKILDMRRYLALMEGRFPGDEVRSAVDNLEVNGNPFGMAFAGRGKWADNLPVAVLGKDTDVDILFFVGCYASFDTRNREIARRFIQICSAAGVRVGILGKEETCCGEPLRKLGNEYLYQLVARKNIELIRGYGIPRVVTTCPHCFNTLSRDYRDLGFHAEVEHYTTFIDGLVNSGALKLEPEAFACTYHDSCYLGRYKGIFTPPRNLLRAAGATIVEMRQCKSESFCCGAGGARIWAEEKLGERLNVKRVSMAVATGAPVLISNCPFCLTMLEDGIKTGNCENTLQVRDLAEVIAARIPALHLAETAGENAALKPDSGEGH
jgi:Fe-S oxidoreductase/nitrate reductase gamma subunit